MKLFRRIIFLLAAVLPFITAGYAQNDAARTDMWVTNGTVQTVVRVGNTLYIGGSFTEVRSPITGEIVQRNNIAALNANTGIPTNWNPGTNGEVRSIVVDNNLVFIGGGFTQVAGQGRNRLAAVNSTNGNLTSWNPDIQGDINAKVYDMLLSGDTLYVAGEYNSIGGVTKNNLAAFNSQTLNLFTSFDLETNGGVFALQKFGNRLYVGGRFSTFKGQPRNNLAAMNVLSGVVVSGWVPNPNGEVHAIVCTSGNVYIGGEFSTISGSSLALIARLAANNASVQDWNAQASGTAVYALALSTDQKTLYVGGNFGAMGGQSRSNLAAVDTKLGPGGNALLWNPVSNGTVADIFVSGSRVYVGGGFGQMGTQTNRNNFAEFNTCQLSVLADAPATVCENATITLNANPSGGTSPFTYSWSPALGLNSVSAKSPQATGLAPGNQSHSVIVSDANNCTAATSVTFNVLAKPTVVVSPESANRCINGPGIQLDATQGLVSYEWTPATGLDNATIFNPVASPTTTTQYILEVTDANGCINRDTADIKVINIQVDAGADQAVCLGTTAQIEATVSGNATNPSYAWAPTAGLSNASIIDPIADINVTTQFTLTVTDASGCIFKDSLTITVNAIPTLDAGADTFVCVNELLQLTATNVTDGSYEWSSTPEALFTNANIRNPFVEYDTPGDFKAFVRVTDASGCQAVDSLLITVRPLPTISLETSKDAICLGETITLTATHDGAIFELDDDPTLAAFNQLITDATPDVPGNKGYIFSATSANNCTAIAQININVFPLPNFSIENGDTAAYCAGSQALLVVAGGTQGTQYSWSPTNDLDAPNSDITFANPATLTTYTVTGTDQNGCVNRDSVVVKSNALPVASVTLGGPSTICPGDTVQLTATGGEFYNWIPVTGLDNPNIAEPKAYPQGTTTYSVIVSDAIGCADTAEVLITVRTAPIAEAGDDIESCLGTALQLAAVELPGLTYLWTDTAATATLSDIAIPNPTVNITTAMQIRYDLTVSDAFGCTAKDFVVVTVKPVPTTDAGNDTTVCAGDVFQLNGTSNGSLNQFVWAPSDGMLNSTTANPTVSPIVTTTYTVTVISPLGCTAVDSVLVTIKDLPTSNITATPPFVCLNNSTQLNADGGIAYIWEPALGLDNPNSASPIATPSETTEYTVTVTGANGCSKANALLIEVKPLPIAEAGADGGFCAGTGGIVLNGSGGVTYSWIPISGLDDPGIANPTAAPEFSTIYTLTVTDDNGCSNTDTVLITVYPLPIVDAGVTDTTSCRGVGIMLNATGASSYIWAPSDDLIGFDTATPIATLLNTTTFTVTGVDSNSCVAIDTIRVTVKDLPALDAGADATICAGQSTPLLASGAVNYKWEPAVALDDPNIAGPVATPPYTITYTVVGEGANGCLAQDTVRVTVLALPIAGVSGNVTICPDSSTQLIANGGIGYNWTPATGLNNPNIAEPIASPSETTVYTVQVTGDNGCTMEQTVQVTVNKQPKPIITPNVPTTICAGGSVLLTVQAIPGYIYQWQRDGQIIFEAFSPAYTVTQAGQYSVLGYYQGCTYASEKVSVSVQPKPNANAGNDTTICKNGGGVMLTATGGTTYKWLPVSGLSNPNAATTNANPIQTTLYTLTVTDANGCSATDEILITVVDAPVVTAAANGPVQFCKGNNVTLSVTQGSGFMYQWKRDNQSILGATNPSYPVNESGSYVAEVTLAGCGTLASNTIVVKVFDLPVVDAGESVTICRSYAAPLNATGGVSYEWAPPTGLSSTVHPNPLASPTNTTTYTVTVTDANGCKASDQVVVFVRQANSLPVPPTSPVGSASFCQGKSVVLSTTQDPFYTYQWKRNGISIENGTQSTLEASLSGLYTVEISNSYCGRAESKAVNVFERLAPRVDLKLTQITCPTCTDGILVITPTGSGQPYQYSLNNGPFFDVEAVNTLTAGEYLLTVRDIYGCMAYISFTMGTGVGIAEEFTGNVSVYPNPNTGVFALKATGLQTATCQVALKDLVGKSLFTRKLNVLGGDLHETFDVNDLPKGVYLLELSDGTRRLTKKIVVR